jgi:hypothetical protein
VQTFLLVSKLYLEATNCTFKLPGMQKLASVQFRQSHCCAAHSGKRRGMLKRQGGCSTPLDLDRDDAQHDTLGEGELASEALRQAP